MANVNEVTWYVYLIKCGNGSLYTGITTDVKRRFQEHKAQGKRTAKFLRGKLPLSLVYVVEVGSKVDALRLEHKIKRMSKNEKETMLTLNPNPIMLQ